jgi:hypothetical protein
VQKRKTNIVEFAMCPVLCSNHFMYLINPSATWGKGSYYYVDEETGFQDGKYVIQGHRIGEASSPGYPALIKLLLFMVCQTASYSVMFEISLDL